MKLPNAFPLGLLTGAFLVHAAFADERRFTYTYEPETLPQGALEFENWVTLRAGRNSAVAQDNYHRWDLRQELEYGVTDRYTLGFYLNEKSESYRDPASGTDVSAFSFAGVSLENRFNVLNPAANAVGLTLYLEGTYAGDEAEVEEKIILGQRHGDWKWALNLVHATEWEDQLKAVEGEVEADLGVARDLGKRFSLGIEVRSHSTLPDYSSWESTALFVGPVVGYRTERFWAACSFLFQVYGRNFDGDPDGEPNLDLAHHEKLNVRFLLGFNF